MQLVIENVQLVIENVHLVTQNTVLYAVSGVPSIHVRLWRTLLRTFSNGGRPELFMEGLMMIFFFFPPSLSLSAGAGQECFMDGLRHDYGCKCSFSSVHLVIENVHLVTQKL